MLRVLQRMIPYPAEVPSKSSNAGLDTVEMYVSGFGRK